MFVARTEELSQLTEAMEKAGSASLVYGKRRVGKTRLIREALKRQNHTALYYECVKGTAKDNIDGFSRVLSENGVLPFSTSFHSFQDIFAFLNTLPGRFVVVIDEYPYLSTFADHRSVDSVFQSIIDNRLGNISLVLSGSQISIMKGLLTEGNALYGRFGLAILLRELDYFEASAFYPSKTVYEKIAFYSVFGGSPFVLQQLREENSLEENIIRTILAENSAVHMYASNILLSDYSNAVNAERILAALANGRKKYSELENRLYGSHTGALAKQLKSLTSMELLRLNSPINRPRDVKKRFYEINDNLMRFFYTFVYPNKSALQMIGPRAFFRQIISPVLLKDFVPRRFEEICRMYFSRLARAGRLPGITNIGTYYYDDPARRQNGEFDIALAFGNMYQIFDSKYYTKPMTADEVHLEAAQVREIKDLTVTELGFIAVNGFEEKEDGYHYIDGEELYTTPSVIPLE